MIMQSQVQNGNICQQLEAFASAQGCYGERDKPFFPAITMPELMNGNYRVHYYCRGVLAQGQPAIVGAPHKCFKTSLMLDLCVCLATGTPFLHHFVVPAPLRVAYFLGEGGLQVAQDTLRRIGAAKDIEIAAIDNFVMTDKVPRLDDVRHLDEVEKFLKEHDPDVAFFDPLYLALGSADTTNVFAMGERLRHMNDLCMPLGVTPVLLHHLRKNRTDNFSPAGLEDLSMAGFAEYAAQWVLLARRTAYDPDDPTHRLWISFGGRSGHGSAWGLDIFEGTIDDPGGRIWQTDLRRQGDVRAEVHGRDAQRRLEKQKAKDAEFEALSNRVLTWIVGKPGGVTEAMVRNVFHMGAAKAGQILYHLEESGEIESCTVVVKNKKSSRKVDGFRAVTDDKDETLFS